MEGNPREHPFWKDLNVYCDRCTRSQFYCTCSRSARGPELPTGQHDKSHGNDEQSDGDHKFDGL